MRNENGVYLGEDKCGFYGKVAEIVEGVCCGGKKMQRAYVFCKKQGTVLADSVCNSRCSMRKFEDKK